MAVQASKSVSRPRPSFRNTEVFVALAGASNRPPHEMTWSESTARLHALRQ